MTVINKDLIKKVHFLFRKFINEHGAATAVVMALMLVPMVLAAGAAVDFARLSASRAQLQGAVDGAAISGVGAYANDQSGTNAINVATSAFNASFAGMANAIALNTSTSPGVTAGCTSTTTSLCGTGYTTMSTSACTAGTYCVTVSATATQKNALFYRLFSEKISVTGTAQYTVPSSSPPGQLVSYNNLTMSYISTPNGTTQFNNPLYSGIGPGTLDPVSNAIGYDPVVYFLDGINSVLPPATLTYASVQPPSTTPACVGSSPTITQVATGLYSAPGGTYCGGLTLGNPPTPNSYYIAGSDASPLSIVNGNLTLAPDTVVCPEIMNNSSYTGAGVTITDPCQTAGDNPANGNYTPIYLGQTTNNGSGALVLSYHFDITPSTGNSGLLTFISNDQGIENSPGFQAWYPAPICPGATSTCTTGSIQATAPVYTGSGTIHYQVTTISTQTIQNGEPVAWTQQNITAVQFNSTQGTTQDTQTAQLGGTYNSSGVPVVHDSATKTSTTAYSPSSYAIGNSTGDAYAQLNAQCTTAATAGKIGGTGAIGNTVGTTPNPPSVLPIAVNGLTDLFALTTAMPPNATPPVAYNFTAPNYGYSEVTSFFRGADLLTQTVYFCGDGNPLSVTAGNATGVAVSSGSNGGAVLTN
jgi:hypothetical protein